MWRGEGGGHLERRGTRTPGEERKGDTWRERTTMGGNGGAWERRSKTARFHKTNPELMLIWNQTRSSKPMLSSVKDAYVPRSHVPN